MARDEWTTQRTPDRDHQQRDGRISAAGARASRRPPTPVTVDALRCAPGRTRAMTSGERVSIIVPVYNEIRTVARGHRPAAGDRSASRRARF